MAGKEASLPLEIEKKSFNDPLLVNFWHAQAIQKEHNPGKHKISKTLQLADCTNSIYQTPHVTKAYGMRKRQIFPIFHIIALGIQMPMPGNRHKNKVDDERNWRLAVKPKSRTADHEQYS